MYWKRVAAVIAVAALGVLLINGAAAAGEPRQMRLGTNLSSKDSVGLGLQKLADLVNARSNSRIKAEVFADAVLGAERTHAEMLRDGSLEVFPNLASGTGRYVPELGVFELPYIYKNDEHVVRVLNALRPTVDQLLAPHNIKPFGYMDIGFRHMLNKKKPIFTPDDLKGLKMRASNPNYLAMFNALGAGGTIITWNEVYTALQAGIVDGLEGSPALIYPMRFQEQAKFLSKTNHIAAMFYFMVNKKWYEELPSDLQKLVVNAIDEASRYQFDTQMVLQREAMDKLVADGVKVNEVASLKAFADKCIEFRSNLLKEKGPKWEELYRKITIVE
jgi:tripartite ATP-independent transporter DctP family solute receptor